MTDTEPAELHAVQIGVEHTKRWLATRFPDIPHVTRSLLIDHALNTLMPYMRVAIFNDAADALDANADVPDGVGDALRASAHDHLTRLTQGGE